MGEGFKLLAHALDGPEKIHRGWAGDALRLAEVLELFAELREVLGLAVACPEGDSHRRGHADRGRAAHHHVADGVRYLLVRLAEEVHLFVRELRLVDEADALLGPFEGFDHTLIL